MGVFFVKFREDSSAELLGRIAARTGTGAATGVDGEGNWLKQADITSVNRKVFDLSGATPDTPTSDSNLTVATVVLDTPVTTNLVWTEDTVGYNFLDQLSASLFAEEEHEIRVEYKVTLTSGQVFFGVYEGPTHPIRGS